MVRVSSVERPSATRTSKRSGGCWRGGGHATGGAPPAVADFFRGVAGIVYEIDSGDPIVGGGAPEMVRGRGPEVDDR